MGHVPHPTNRCDNRIVSIGQPHVQPMVRGKLNKHVEFSAKLSVSLTGDGLAHVDILRWDAFHEGLDLTAQVEAYRDRYGHYSECVLADQIYGTRSNRITSHNAAFILPASHWAVRNKRPTKTVNS